ncbi:MAG: right-handed parallel beta-helix repeat-containing protein [Candidatus Micrarchaeota archaeon]|nr:right-handed parallel beta-helix repeat-containing protein [Candidatus Micrarchaeota archaeon]
MRFTGFAVAWLSAIVLIACAAAAATTVSACGSSLNAAGETYELNQSISLAGGTCLIINAANITLDCQGHSITGDRDAATLAIEVSPSADNATVKGCELEDHGTGIYIDSGTVNHVITNNTIHDARDAGIESDSSCNNTVIFNNTIYDVYTDDFLVGTGIWMRGEYHNISFNSVSNIGQDGIILSPSNHSVVSFNSVNWTHYEAGIYVDGGGSYENPNAEYITISGNNVTSPGVDDVTDGAAGIYVAGRHCNVSYNRVYNSTAAGTASTGMEFYYGYNNTVAGNNVSFNNMGIVVYAEGTVLRNNVADGNAFEAYAIGVISDADFSATGDYDIDSSNTANGDPIHYYYGASDLVIQGLSLSGANTAGGKVTCVKCTNMVIKNSVFANNAGDASSELFLAGVLLVNSTNVVVMTNTMQTNSYAVWIYGGTNITIKENNFSTQNTAGILVHSNATEGYETTELSLVDNYGSDNAEWLSFEGEPISWSVSKNGFRLSYYNVSSTEAVEPNIYLASGVIAVNTTANPALNTSANVTLTFAGSCPRIDLYYYANYSTSLSEIVANGQLCNSTSTPACNIISCSGNTVTFSVSHFDSYGGQGYDIPEFSGLAALFAAALAGAGYALARKRK